MKKKRNKLFNFLMLVIGSNTKIVLKLKHQKNKTNKKGMFLEQIKVLIIQIKVLKWKKIWKIKRLKPKMSINRILRILKIKPLTQILELVKLLKNE